MCGIAGLVYKNTKHFSADLLEMLQCIQHRGPDASGIALFGDSEDLVLRVTIKAKELENQVLSVINEFGKVVGNYEFYASGNVWFADISLDVSEDKKAQLHESLNEIKGVTVHSLSRKLKIFKENGPITNLTNHHVVSSGNGAVHGIGHVRMATESAEDVNAAHPFSSPFFPDLAIVHNGQFTNYFKMRRFLESKGCIFKTMNDSEAASHLIAYAMKENDGDLEAALQFALDEMDGIFCILAATPTQIGFVKDKLGVKPLLLIEDDEKIMIGSEQIEFSSLAGNSFAEEMEPGEVRVWNI